MTDSQEIETAAMNADDVLDYLRDNPKFLSQNPEACDFLIPPKNMDKNVADFQGFMIKRLQDDKEKVIETTQSIVENVRSNMNNQQRIHKVILRLLEAVSYTHLPSPRDRG